MKAKKELELFAGVIQFLHIIIFFIAVSSMILIWVSKDLRLYAAFFLGGMYVIEMAFGGCPLTIEEYKLRKEAGEHIKKKTFIPSFFKKYLNINIPDWLANLWLGLYFVISVYVIISHFFL